ncbi:MAG: HAD hydrolase-like protein [archaeon]
MGNIQAVVFDWNGTLLADAHACWETDNEVLKKFGGKPISFKTFRDTFIIPSWEFYKKHGIPIKKQEEVHEEMTKTFHEFYEKRAKGCRTRRHAKCVLEYIQKRGAETSILSNHTVAGIEFQLERLGLEENIDLLIANSEKGASFKARNKGDKMKDYLEQRGYDPGKVIIVGDAPEEVEIGKSLKVRTVAITDGYYSTKRLKEAKPDKLITNLEEIKYIFDKWNS